MDDKRLAAIEVAIVDFGITAAQTGEAFHKGGQILKELRLANHINRPILQPSQLDRAAVCIIS
ncbi:hypothetical protein NTGM5_480001 [Candidatus Nitrotoga sp. M5]|nr:hypothetical protein NTGM5_480001 [Candidatus Nitrotoga sp. M5]